MVKKMMSNPRPTSHRSPIRKVKILGLGHPRTGTGYVTKLLNLWGMDVGHEISRPDGTVAWPLIRDRFDPLYSHSALGYHFAKLFQDYGYKRPDSDVLIYNTRDPRHTIPSMVYTVWEQGSEANRIMRDLGWTPSANPIDQSIDSICLFDDVIRKLKPDIYYRIEDPDKELWEQLNSKLFDLGGYVEHSQPENTRPHRSFESMIQQFGPPSYCHQRQLDLYCRRHSYRKIKWLTNG